MDDHDRYTSAPRDPASAGLQERTRQALEDVTSTGDAGRLELLESLYEELSGELERDVAENPSSRR